MPAAGDHRGDYVLVGLRARAGQAEVWEAHREGAPAERVALRLGPASCTGPESPHVLRTLAHGDGYEVLEWVNGGTLRDRLGREGPITWREAADIAVQYLEALEVAHPAGIVHGDLKPENVLLSDEGSACDHDHGPCRVRVGDFGMAPSVPDDAAAASGRLGEDAAWVGTREYAPPEGRPSERGDVYAAGVVLFEMLTGKLPRGVFRYPGEADGATPRALDTVLHRALQPDPAARYGTAREMREDLADVLAGRTPRSGGGVRPERRGVSADREVLDVGGIRRGYVWEGGFHLLHDGRADVTIRDIDVEGPAWMRAHAGGDAGGSVRIAVTVDTRGLPAETPVEGRVRVRHASGEVAMPVRGKVVERPPRPVGIPERLVLCDSLVGRSAVLPIGNDGDAPLPLRAVAPPWLTCQVEHDVPPGGTAGVILRLETEPAEGARGTLEWTWGDATAETAVSWRPPRAGRIGSVIVGVILSLLLPVLFGWFFIPLSAAVCMAVAPAAGTWVEPAFFPSRGALGRWAWRRAFADTAACYVLGAVVMTAISEPARGPYGAFRLWLQALMGL